MRTIVYIDGYNFYYGCCRRSRHKWINLRRLMEKLLPPPHAIGHIYYFTAAIKSPPHNPGTQQRQFLFWRALRTLPALTIVEGKFLESPKRLPWAEPRPLRWLKRRLCGWPALRPYLAPILVRVWKTEEKRSDVNLATQLLLDAFDDKFDCAVIVSNDSDLIAPIRQVRRRFGKKIGILTGHAHPSKELQGETDFLKRIREGVLTESLFPDTLTDIQGAFHRPAAW